MKKRMLSALISLSLAPSAVLALDAGTIETTMIDGFPGYATMPLLTVGEEINGYTPPGVLDGLGAYELDDETVRVLANHELGQNRGYPYTVNGSLELIGARVSWFDIDKDSMQIEAGGLAYDTIYDAFGGVPTDKGFLGTPFYNSSSDTWFAPGGLSRLCSASHFPAHEFGNGRGLEEMAFFTGEEDGGNFNNVGGAQWVLDPVENALWQLPDLGRGAWENVTVVDTGDADTVAILLMDDTSPFDADGIPGVEAAPLYLYVGEKDPNGDFPARNGLRGGTLYVWVAKNGALDPRDFNTKGSLAGKWVEIDNSRDEGKADPTGQSGYDVNGYPTQRTLWTRAKMLGAFGFSRPEDVATNPAKGNEVVLASTGRSNDFDKADRVGTTYTLATNFKNMSATLKIVYDGDADPTQAIRSPDNLDWADDGMVYIQEDSAASGLFGYVTPNTSEAGVIKLDPKTGKTHRIANIVRSVLLDASLGDAPTGPDDDDPLAYETAVDVDSAIVGAWESSGIVDVSDLFDSAPGTMFLLDVQAHGIEDQDTFNPGSRIVDNDLVEGGQLILLTKDLED
jgi:hypothetical protein